MHGYSSSEESDDPRRPRSQPASSGNNQDQKKKRKRRLPPQQTINRLWKRFSNRKFHKAVSVLPFDPVVAPRSGLDRPNELLSESYERAAEECRRKVQKIVQECKRVNMRYRDPGWDLVSSHSQDILFPPQSWANTIARTGISSMRRATPSTTSEPKSLRFPRPPCWAPRRSCPRPSSESTRSSKSPRS